MKIYTVRLEALKRNNSTLEIYPIFAWDDNEAQFIAKRMATGLATVENRAVEWHIDGVDDNIARRVRPFTMEDIPQDFKYAHSGRMLTIDIGSEDVTQDVVSQMMNRPILVAMSEGHDNQEDYREPETRRLLKKAYDQGFDWVRFDYD